MKRLHILGRKNHGKTTLVVDLTAHFTALGYRVGTIKHTHHQHELDVPGKDSHRHRAAGAAVGGILSRSTAAVFWSTTDESAVEDRYAQFAPHFADCDFVLVEGDTQTTAPRIEVWRAEIGGEPLAVADLGIAAVVADERCPAAVEWWPRSDLAGLGGNILRLLVMRDANEPN